MPREQQTYVFIYLPGETVAVPAGIFTHYPDDGIGKFEYGRRYLDRSNALPVDPVALRLGVPINDVSTNGGMYGTFRDSSPDYWGRLVIAAEMKLPPEALTEMDYLLQANASRVGNLDFRMSINQGETENNPPTFQLLGDILGAATRLQEGQEVSKDLLRLLEQGSSVGGARPKCTVEMNDGLWLAKFPAKNDTVNYPRIEYATMTLAKMCGINVPDLQLVDIGGRDVLMVKRFDREKTDRGYLRFGFLSALSLMEWDDRDRIDWSYPSLSGRMRSAILAHQDQLHELFRRMVFNMLCRNTDDHPRNHGFLWGAQGYKLSPAYDIVPTPTQPGVGTDFNLSMSLGASGRDASPTNALSQSTQFGLQRHEAENVIHKMMTYTRIWEEHFREAKVSDRDIEGVRACFSINQPI